MTEVEYNSEIKFTKDTPHLTLSGKLCSVYCKDLGENWPRYKGTAQYSFILKKKKQKNKTAAQGQINGLVQERHNSIVDALELRLSCTNPSKYDAA